MNGFRKFIRDDLLCGNSSNDAFFILQLAAVDEARKSVRLAEVRGFTKYDAKVVPEENGCLSLEASDSLCQDAIFLIRRWIAAVDSGRLTG